MKRVTEKRKARTDEVSLPPLEVVQPPVGPVSISGPAHRRDVELEEGDLLQLPLART